MSTLRRAPGGLTGRSMVIASGLLERSFNTMAGSLEKSRDELVASRARIVAGALEELRELSRGIHAAILSEGGLRPALKALARRSPRSSWRWTHGCPSRSR